VKNCWPLFFFGLVEGELGFFVELVFKCNVVLRRVRGEAESKRYADYGYFENDVD